MKHLFVSYEIAKQLKEKGFDEKCLGYINQEGKTYLFDFMLLDQYGLESNEEYEGILSPLYQQVIDWFREEHRLFITIIDGDKRNDNIFYWFQVYDLNKQSAVVAVLDQEYKTYYEALDKAIEEALKLI